MIRNIKITLVTMACLVTLYALAQVPLHPVKVYQTLNDVENTCLSLKPFIVGEFVDQPEVGSMSIWADIDLKGSKSPKPKIWIEVAFDDGFTARTETVIEPSEDGDFKLYSRIENLQVIPSRLTATFVTEQPDCRGETIAGIVSFMAQERKLSTLDVLKNLIMSV